MNDTATTVTEAPAPKTPAKKKRRARPAASAASAPSMKFVTSASSAPSAKSTRPAAAAKERKPVAKKEKPADLPSGKPSKKKLKPVRDSFTMPAADFALIGQMKARALEMKRPAKKSELLRAGLRVLSALSDKALIQALEQLEPVKPGRPKGAGGLSDR